MALLYNVTEFPSIASGGIFTVVDGSVEVGVFGGVASGGYFTEVSGSLNPEILSVSPSRGFRGSLITITGSGFGETAGFVVVGGETIEVASWTDLRVTGYISQDTPIGIHDVVLVTSGYLLSRFTSFEVTSTFVPSEPDTTTTVFPVTGPDKREDSAFKLYRVASAVLYYYDAGDGNFVISTTEDDSLGVYYTQLPNNQLLLGRASLIEGSVLLWATSTPYMTIDGVSIQFEQVYTNNGWSIYRSVDPISRSGDVIISAVDADICYFDIRGKNGAFDLSTVKYHYDDVLNNSGNSTLPLF